MVVGNDIPVFVDNKTRAQTALFKIVGRVVFKERAKKLLERIARPKWSFLSKRSLKMTEDLPAALNCFNGANVDNTRARLFSELAEIDRNENGLVVFSDRRSCKAGQGKKDGNPNRREPGCKSICLHGKSSPINYFYR